MLLPNARKQPQLGARIARNDEHRMHGGNELCLGWVDLVLVVALSAWKGGNLAELAEQLDTMVEHPNQSQPNHATNQSCHPV